MDTTKSDAIRRKFNVHTRVKATENFKGGAATVCYLVPDNQAEALWDFLEVIVLSARDKNNTLGQSLIAEHWNAEFDDLLFQMQVHEYLFRGMPNEEISKQYRREQWVLDTRLLEFNLGTNIGLIPLETHPPTPSKLISSLAACMRDRVDAAALATLTGEKP